jgi:hypothetical protein
MHTEACLVGIVRDDLKLSDVIHFPFLAKNGTYTPKRDTGDKDAPFS